jgi:hypothetical protein
MPDERVVSRLHCQLIRSLLEQGACPSNSALAQQVGVAPAEIEDLLRALSDIHGIVLHPHACAPWIIHPFSVTPTINWIQGPQRGWWAPCLWCALGVATLVRRPVQVHTHYGGEAEPLTIPVIHGQPVGFESVRVHFAIPPARAWDNVHQHCSMVLPFHSPDEIGDWCERHSLPRGQAVPLNQVARLAQLWYGPYADPDWHK